MLKKYIDIIHSNALFKDFTEESIYAFFQTYNYKILKYKTNNIIYFESEKCLSLDIILQGEVTIQKIDEKGNILTIVNFLEGDSMGGNLLFSKHPYYPMNITAKRNAIILHISKEMVIELCQNNKDFLLEFLSQASDKTRILSNKISSISMKTIRDSIIDFINYKYYSQKNIQ